MMHDIGAAIGATTRAVRKDERDGKPSEAVIAEHPYDTGINDLWDALISPDRLPRWPGNVSGDYRLGAASRSRTMRPAVFLRVIRRAL